MSLYDYIKEGVEGSANLKTIYKDYNREYFGSSLPKIKLKWSGKLKRAIGRARVNYKSTGYLVKGSLGSLMSKYSNEMQPQNVEINMDSLEIAISTMNDLSLDDIKAVMLHEMVHILLYSQRKITYEHHGTPEFDGWIKKLRTATGLNIPFKESSFKASPKLSTKEGFVVKINHPDETFGLLSYTKQFWQKSWLEWMDMMQRILKKTYKIQSLEMLKVNHPVVSTLTPRRSLHGLSWIQIDSDTANEITRKGTIFGKLNKMGGFIEPRVFGVNEPIKTFGKII